MRLTVLEWIIIAAIIAIFLSVAIPQYQLYKERHRVEWQPSDWEITE